MEDKGCFKLPINLQKFSAVTLSAMLWAGPDVKKDIKQILKSASKLPKYDFCKLQCQSPCEYDKWRGVTEKVLNLSEALNLPACVTAQLSEFIIFMGNKIFSTFLAMIGDDIKFNRKFLNKIFFTNQGVLDRVKMYQEWKTDRSFPEFHKNADKNIMIASCMACIHGDFDYLRRQPLIKIASAIRKNLPRDAKLTDWNKAIAYLLIWRMSTASSESSPLHRNYFHTHYDGLFQNPKYPNGEEKLFTYCVNSGYEIAAECFYNKLDPIDQENMILSAATECINNCRQGSMMEKISEEYLEKRVRVMLFVFKKMSDDQKKEFLVQKMTKVFPIFLKTWPYKYLCVALLDYVWEDLSLTTKSLILKTFFHQLYDFSALRHRNVLMRADQEILQYLLRKCSADLKFDVFHRKNRDPNRGFPHNHSLLEDHRNGLFELLKKSDCFSLKMIITDPDLVRHREELINMTGLLTEYILKEKDFELVRDNIVKFMEELEFSNIEKDKYFEAFNKIEIFEKMIRDVRFSAVNQMVKWIYDGDREKMDERFNDIRKALDSQTIYSHIIENGNYSESERFLEWQYDGRYEELENFKKQTVTNEFICEKFWCVWLKTFFNSNFESLISRFECFKLLEHFFKTPGELDTFRRHTLVENDNCIKTFCNSLMKLQNTIEIQSREKFQELRANPLLGMSYAYGDPTKCFKLTKSKNFATALNDALTFCSASPTKINDLKRSVKDNVDWWCDMYIGNKYKFHILNALVCWIQFEESEFKNFIKNFFESSRGALLIVNFFVDDSVTCIYELDKILTDWVKQYGHVDRIKEEIRKLENADVRGVEQATSFLNHL